MHKLKEIMKLSTPARTEIEHTTKHAHSL